ncbi:MULTISPECIES: signal protein [unclassified Streptomyces]|uniref:signal protein n=1 Tax=unclassified Streptomyces TaxID=2593676 RepID=UPI003663F45B
MRIGRSFALLGATALLVGACTAPDAAEVARQPQPGIAELSTGELQSRWWSWAASSPEDSNPVTDPDGSFCAQKQPTDAWFLAGTFGGRAERRCSIPAERPVVFPLLNFTGTKAECSARLAEAKGTVRLGTTEVAVERIEPTPIRITGVEGNPVTGQAESLATHGCGLWVRLGPVPAGTASLTIEGSAGSFSLSVTYNLQVA